jgi:hypothetical protein
MLISIFCPVFSGSTFFSMTLESWIPNNLGIFIGEINRYDAAFNHYRDSDPLFAKSLSSLTAREAILGSTSDVFRCNIASFYELFLQIIERDHTFIIEDSKHADWFSYISSDVQSAGLEWLNIILFRDPRKWLKSYLQSSEITDSQALLEQYCSQYAYYLDNQMQSCTQTIYINFDHFLVNPTNAKLVILRSLGFPDLAISSLPNANPLRLPNAIGGNLKSYISCVDFPKNLSAQNNPPYQLIRNLVDSFFPYESTEHNHDFTLAFMAHTKYPKARKKRASSRRVAHTFSWVTNKLVRESLRNTYDFLCSQAAN